MKKVKLNALVDVFSLIVFFISLISGIVIWLVLPSGSAFLGSKGLTRRDWIDIHTVSSLLFVILVISHHILHWGWFKNLPKIISG